MSKLQKTLIFILIFVLIFSLAGCRKRTADSALNVAQKEETIDDNANSTKDKTGDQKEKSDETKKKSVSDSESNDTIVSSNDSGEGTTPKDNGKGNGKGKNKKAKPSSGNNTIKKPGDSGEKDNDSGGAEDESDKYAQLLKERLDGSYPCQRYYTYIETESQYVTVNRSSSLHTVANRGGCYNIAETLGSGSLTIDSQWVQDSNPQAIIKLVGSGTLGKGVTSDSAARSVYTSITNRYRWNNISAVSDGRVLIISRELMNTSKGRTITALYIAKALHPDRFDDINVDDARDDLLGAGYEGIYVYKP